MLIYCTIVEKYLKTYKTSHTKPDCGNEDGATHSPRDSRDNGPLEATLYEQLGGVVRVYRAMPQQRSTITALAPTDAVAAHVHYPAVAFITEVALTAVLVLRNHIRLLYHMYYYVTTYFHPNICLTHRFRAKIAVFITLFCKFNKDNFSCN